jgi:four helix bundle protein
MKKHNFREIKIWQEALLMVKEVYLFSSKLPKEEKYGIISQINRSAVSIPSNIAEGSGRTTNKEFVRFLEIAISSSYELETQLILAEELFDLSSIDLIKNLNVLQNRIGGFTRQIKSRIENDI